MELRHAAIDLEARMAGSNPDTPCIWVGNPRAWMYRGEPAEYIKDRPPIPFVFRSWRCFILESWNKADAYMYTTVGEKAVREHLNSDLARLVGAFVSDGHEFQDGL
jgi:hypothetical protein